MSSYINRLRRTIPRGRVSGDGRVSRPTDLPLDHCLTFSPQPDEKWTYEDGRGVLFNGASAGEIVGENGNDVRVLCGMSQGLYEYQQFIWGKGGKSHAHFNAAVISLQDKILGRLGTIYDGLTGGVRFESDGPDFWINNVNVCSVLNLYRLKPTDKARRYLMGLRDKLGLILSQRQSSTRYDGIHDRARQIFDEISLALEYIPADAPYLLGDGSRNS